MSERDLYFASTPLIVLEAAAMALARGARARLMLLEDFDQAADLVRLIEGWRDNPFERIQTLPGRHTEHVRGAPDRERGLRQSLRRVRIKRALREETLAAVRAQDAAFAPAAVWLGNDRKVETQLALHLASSRTGTRAGRYLDDGLYTYLGDVRQRPLIRRVDWLLKQATYGRWWHRADQAGTTPWIAESWLVYPALARDQAPGRQRRALPPALFDNRAFLRLCLRAARQSGLDRATLRGCACVLVLPHSNQLRANPRSTAALRALVAEAAAKGHAVAIKYHPRESERDPGGLLGAGSIRALPGLLPMELLLPLLPRGAVLLGEGSTALIAAHWLRPDLAVADLGLNREGYAARARGLFARLGIPSFEGRAETIAAALGGAPGAG
ncbi:hypothetical protein [Coralloluteibacterium stylophorae]|uniref:Uncharacterized protein n=1 Tax=Coralloluteibacterium stylophorae TaxID=1776034 RepID=A0A8J8AXS8_9GAMM|nr:hypothetical protein [Coralloluteibacterium stylophorae]MBS7457940.1 hypothetical protein [Coralloluteibacterium stylophorae]